MSTNTHLKTQLFSHLRTRPVGKVLVIVTACAVLCSCAVSPGKVAEQAQSKTEQISAAQEQAKKQRQIEPPLLRIKGNYLGSVPQPRSASGLPARLHDFVLNFGPGKGSLQAVAENLRVATGLAVRVNADVYNSTGVVSVQPVAAPAAPAASVSSAGIPAPSANAGIGTSTGSSGKLLAVPASAFSTQLPLSFSGDLSDYLDQIASAVGINWEFNNGEIHFHRLTTRVFNVMLSPGQIAYRDDMTGGGSGSMTGSSSNSGQGNASFGSTSQSSVNATFDPWASLSESIRTMLSASGRLAVNQSSGTVVITDNRDVVERVARYVEAQNASYTAQVAIEVREIEVTLNDASQFGVDLNLVYQRLNAVSGNADWGFKFAAPSTLTDSSAGSVGYNITKAGSSLNGSSVATQALNSFGTVLSDVTDTIITTNRVPGRKQNVTDRAYLASTTPGSGSASGTGTGVPGLNPGIVSYGNNLAVVPTIGDNRNVLLQFFDTRSTLTGFGTATTGSGLTLQQINTPELSRKKFSQNFWVGSGETLVIVGNNGDSWSSNSAVGVTGGSLKGSKTKTLQVLLVTPRILQGS